MALVALEERERIERLERRGLLNDLGRLVNYAMAAQGKPDDALSVEARAYERALGASPLGHAAPVSEITDDEMAIAAQILSVIYRGTAPADPQVS